MRLTLEDGDGLSTRDGVEMSHALRGNRAIRLKVKCSNRGIVRLNLNGQQFGWQSGSNPIGPFDDDHGVRAEQFVESQCKQLGGPAKSIRVDVKDRQSSRVFLDERERRAGDSSSIGFAVALCNTLDQVSLPGPKRADQGDRDSPDQ